MASAMTVPRPVSLSSVVRRIARGQQETKVYYKSTEFNMTKPDGGTYGFLTAQKYFDPFSGIQPGVGLLQRVGDEIFVTKIIVSLAFKAVSDPFVDYKFCGKLVSSSAFQTNTSSTWNDYSGAAPNLTDGTAGTVAWYLNQIDGTPDKEVMRVHSEKKHTFRAAGLSTGSTGGWGFGAGLTTWKHTINLNRKIRFLKQTSDQADSGNEFIYLFYGCSGQKNTTKTEGSNVDNVVSCTYTVFFKDA